MANPWYPFYPGDYGRDTGRLSLIEHGAYILLLNDYYSTGGPLPLDPRELFCICKAFTQEEQAATMKVIGMFFTETREGYRSNRADKELSQQEANQEKRKDRAKKGAAARWGKEERVETVEASSNAQAMQQASKADAKSNAYAMPPQPQPQPQPQPHKEEKTSSSSSTSQEIETVVDETVDQVTKMTRKEFAKLYFTTFGKQMSGMLNHDAERICARYDPEKIRGAFLIAAENSASSFKYVEAVLEGKYQRSAPEDKKGKSPASAVEVGSRWRGIKTGIIYEVTEVFGAFAQLLDTSTQESAPVEKVIVTNAEWFEQLTQD